MAIIWSRESASATDVQQALLPKHDFKDSTVRTMLTRLEDKGYLRHALAGRAFVYSSVEPPRNLAVRAVKQIMNRFCQGSVESLLTGMVDDQIVNPEELRQIADRLAAGRLAKPAKVAKKRS